MFATDAVIPSVKRQLTGTDYLDVKPSPRIPLFVDFPVELKSLMFTGTVEWLFDDYLQRRLGRLNMCSKALLIDVIYCRSVLLYSSRFKLLPATNSIVRFPFTESATLNLFDDGDIKAAGDLIRSFGQRFPVARKLTIHTTRFSENDRDLVKYWTPPATIQKLIIVCSHFHARLYSTEEWCTDLISRCYNLTVVKIQNGLGNPSLETLEKIFACSPRLRHVVIETVEELPQSFFLDSEQFLIEHIEFWCNWIRRVLPSAPTPACLDIPAWNPRLLWKSCEMYFSNSIAVILKNNKLEPSLGDLNMMYGWKTDRFWLVDSKENEAFIDWWINLDSITPDLLYKWLSTILLWDREHIVEKVVLRILTWLRCRDQPTPYSVSDWLLVGCLPKISVCRMITIEYVIRIHRQQFENISIYEGELPIGFFCCFSPNDTEIPLQIKLDEIDTARLINHPNFLPEQKTADVFSVIKSEVTNATIRTNYKPSMTIENLTLEKAQDIVTWICLYHSRKNRVLAAFIMSLVKRFGSTVEPEYLVKTLEPEHGWGGYLRRSRQQ